VKGDVLVERYDVVERCAAEEGDKITADGEKDEDDVDMEDEGSRAGDDCSECH